MTIRWYFLPANAGGSTHADPRAPLYVGATGAQWNALDYGLEPVFLTWADVTPAQHAAIVANTDVIALPTDIDATLTAGAVTSAQTALEAMNIPAGWINTSLTYRDVLRKIAGLFQFAQAWHGAGGGRIFGAGVSMDLQFQQLPLAARQRLQSVAQAMNYDTSGLTATTTLRVILKNLADQWGAKPIFIGGTQI